ncbi:MAG TPA: TonB-dependent receptor plug domain-containing protein [Labilithrix sp.]
MRGAAAFFVLACAASRADIARAQPPPPPPAVPVMPPRAVSAPEPPYPEGASGDATVVLELLVSVEGAVDDAKPIAGEEPFTTAAATAAKSWRFEPATHGGHPVAARIKFEVKFHAPAPPPVQEPPPPPPPPKPGAPKPPEAPQEVTVYGSKTPPGAVSLGRAEVRQLPGAFGDPFRALDALPGVTPIVSGLPFFYIRGAPPGNVGYFLDGVKVPYLFHVGFGPSVLHPGMIDRVDLYPGSYPAKYGRFAGAVVSAETVAPRPDLHGEANVRLFDLGALGETGFADGKGTALVAGRYSYTAAILSLIAPDTRLDYRDFETRVTYDLSPKDRVSVLGFGAFDLLTQTVNGIDTVLFGSEFYRADIRYDRAIDADTNARVAVTLGFDQNRIPGQPRNSQDTSYAARLELTHAASDRVTVRGGADASIEHYTADSQPYADPDDPDVKRFNALFPPRDDVTAGAWTDLVLKLPRWQVIPGIRADIFSSNGATKIGVDPRLASRVDATKTIHILETFGLAHQPPSYVIPLPGLAIGSLQGGLQQSVQSSAGIEFDLPEATTATVNVFDNVFMNMSDTLGVAQTDNDPARQANREPRSQGNAYGAELYVRRKLTKRFGGYLSYTLSRSVRAVDRERFVSAFDRPHVFNAAVAYDLGKNWRAGTRFTAYSGTPVVPAGGNGLTPPPRSLNPDRDPAFYRLDLRLEKRWNLSPKAWISFVAEIMNATFHKETVLGTEIGPVTIPSIGVEGAYN